MGSNLMVWKDLRAGRCYSSHLLWVCICRFGHPNNGPWCGHVLSKNPWAKNCRVLPCGDAKFESEQGCITKMAPCEVRTYLALQTPFWEA